ncbi:hypothetical protein CKCBHOJB_03395 [Thauera sp. GDN1]|uniref:glycosyltransferase family 25 protein n=1 Tax=Thauera sp. GDN1 TaxID=2944810 RepID=UPI00247AFF94|nr:glycosyltransferase family 25 protein [Thauera sp. GDN1]WEN43765.1 hypothetical protein CKCBHOJB_03395 [Thauera sp. GDN1]
MSTHSPLADGVLVINLDKRSDRWQSFITNAADRLAPLIPIRLSAVKGVSLEGFGHKPYFHGRKRDRTWAGRAGCALSHRAAIETAARSGWKRVLILEDDIQFEHDFDALIEPLKQALDTTRWDVCYLGYTDPIGPFRESAQLSGQYRLVQIYGCNAAHAYLVNQSAYSFLLSQLPTRQSVWRWLTRNRAIDRWYARTLSRAMIVLALSTSIINQKDDISDITGRSYEKQHVTAIPDNARRTLPYSVSKALRRTLFWLQGLHDAGRGWIKRKRGF